MKPPVFLTGATGFLGMEVLARLLEAGDREVSRSCARATTPRPQERLDGVLAKLWRDPSPYRDRVARRRRRRHRAGPRASTPASARALAEEVGAVLHCAASISFDLPLDEARAINVEGTREMLGFAREAKALGRLERFVHVSTAYVAGDHEGTFRERQLDAGQEFRNTYEQTKWEAEQIVARGRRPRARRSRARASSWASPTRAGRRPSTSSTGRCARSRAGCSTRSRRCPTARVDVVPVDYVADALVHLLDAPRPGVFNLVAGRDAPHGRRARRAGLRPLRQAAARGRRPERRARRRRRARRGLLAVLRHGRRLRRLARPRAARPGRHPRAAAAPTTSAR